MRRWQIQQAKNKFSEVLEASRMHGPQVVTRHGQEVAVILSYSEFQILRPRQTSFTDFFRDAPLTELDLRRDESALRETDEFVD